MMARAVAFLDLDGTILDSSPGIVAGLRQAFAAVDVAVPDDEVLRSWIGPPVIRTLERELGPSGEAVVSAANGAFRAYFDEVGAYESEPFMAVPEVMGAMHRSGTRLAVVTHKPARLAEIALAQHSLDGLVYSVHAPPSPQANVPKTELFARAIEATNPACAVAAGDRAGDVEAATAHGIATVGVAWGYGTEEELRVAGAVAVASSPEELPLLLGEYAAPLA